MTATSSAGEKRRVPSYSEGVADSATRQRLLHLTAPHVESFDYFLSTGMHAAVSDVSPLEMRIESATPNPPTAPNPPKPSSSSLPSSSSSSASSKPLFVRLLFTSIRVGVPLKGDDGVELPLTPREARERGLNYAGQMFAGVTVLVNDTQEMRFEVSLGDFPIMVLSERCHLKNLSPNELIALREEGNELGGYFIVNGIERIIRLLQVPRRNFATAIERSSFRNRGTDYSDKGVAMRCARRDQSSITITLHYLTSGNITLRMVVRKQEFLLPVMLIAKALMPISDREIFDRVLQKGTCLLFSTIV